MSHCASKVDQSAFGQKDDVAAVLHGEPIDLGLDVGLLGTVLFQPLDVDFAVKMTNVTDNGVISHLFKVFAGEDIFATGGGDENLSALDSVFDGGDFVTFAGGL